MPNAAAASAGVRNPPKTSSTATARRFASLVPPWTAWAPRGAFRLATGVAVEGWFMGRLLVLRASRRWRNHQAHHPFSRTSHRAPMFPGLDRFRGSARPLLAIHRDRPVAAIHHRPLRPRIACRNSQPGGCGRSISSRPSPPRCRITRSPSRWTLNGLPSNNPVR